MKDKEVLQKAIEIAIENGHTAMSNAFVCDNLGVLFKNGDQVGNSSFRDVLFSHDFAKAFWGEEKKNIIKEVELPGGYKKKAIIEKLSIWQHHLQQIVLCDNPIDYLRKFINTENSLS